MRIAIRILFVAVVAMMAFVMFGRFAPDGSWLADASDQFLRAIRVSWMMDPIAN